MIPGGLRKYFDSVKLWWDKIIVHHSWSLDHGTLDWPGIRTYHCSYRIDAHIVSYDEYKRRLAIKDGKLFQKKWFDDDPGYHFGVEDYKGHYEILMGLPITLHGVHCPGQNSHSLGVCFTGNYDEVAPSEAMLKYAATHLFAPLLKISGYDVDIIEPHRKYANKSCPGKKFDVNHLKDIIRKML